VAYPKVTILVRLFDPLSNVGTSRVLFLLVLGVKTPKALAEKLGVRPPSIIDQLHRLKKVRLARLGKKVGKEQHYEIDWNRLVDVSVHRSLHLPQPDIKEQDAAELLAKQFLGKEKFREFMKSYLEIRLAETPLNLLLDSGITFIDLLLDLHATVTGMMTEETLRENLEAHVRKDTSLQDVFNSLILWRDFAHHVSNISRLAFIRALHNSGFEIE